MRPSVHDAPGFSRTLPLRALAGVLSLAIFAADLQIPLGVASAVPYVFVVLAAIAFGGLWEPFFWALACTGLTLLGFALSVNHDETVRWMVVANRAVAVLAIWVTAGVATAWRREHRALEGSRRRIAGIVDSAMDAMISVDAAQRIVHFNRAAERIFGRRSRDVIGEPLDVLIPARFRERHRGHVARFAASDEGPRRMAEHDEALGLRASGEEFPLEASISRVEADGEDGGLTVILRDVSARRRAEEERREVEQRARTAEELAAVGTLTAGIAHDVGTPMNVILGYAEMLERSLEKPRNRERAAIIAAQVRRVSGLVRTLLDMARPRHIQPVPVDLASTLEHSLAFFQEKLRHRGIEVEKRFEEVPPVMGDPDRLQQVFLNLLVNAADAMPDGGRLRVTLEATDGDRVTVRIRDTGVGIAPDELGRIFEAFYTTKDHGRGSGLGLVVARGIVLDHGGSIDVTSEPGKGTEFAIALPRDGPGELPGARGEPPRG